MTKKFIPAVIVSASLVLVLAVAALSGTQGVTAANPSDFDLVSGDRITVGTANGDPDVFIVDNAMHEKNAMGFKRVFLNPTICLFYGQFGNGGCFSNMKTVSTSVRDAFGTSCYYTNGETKDGKVYYLEATGPDTGMLRHLQITGDQAAAFDGNFFLKVFQINTNEYNWYPKGAPITSTADIPNCTTGTTSGTPTPPPGNVTLSLASDNPAAMNITRKANGLTYLKFTAMGTGTISSIKIYRKGPGANSDFDNVYLYEGAQRLTSGRTPGSDGSITFSGLNLAVAGSRTLSVVADMLSTGAVVGDVNYFSVMAAADVMLTSGTVGGSFPLNGNNMTVTGATGGTVTVAKTGSVSNPNVGQTNALLSEFKLTMATEGGKVHRVQLINGGNVKTTDITNLRLEVNGTVVATGNMTTDGYALFDFGSTPYLIAKGDNRIFKVYGDLFGKKSETIDFYLEQTADVLVIGTDNGFGVSVTNNFNNSSNSHTITLQGGVLTLSFVGPTASNVSTTTTRTHFLEFDMNSAANIEIRKTTLVFCMDDTGDGTYEDNADTTNGVPDLLNVGMIDRDSGVFLIGPVDGSSLKTSNAGSCPNSKTGASNQFTNSFNINTNQTLHLAIVGDVKVDSTTTETADIASGAIIKFILDGYGDAVGTSGDLTIMKYTGTNTAVTSTDIVPSGDLSGNGMTVQGSSLTVARSSTPSGQNNFVMGTSKINALGLNFTAALGSDIKITDITLSGYVADSGTTLTLGVGAAPDTALNVQKLVEAVRLMDNATNTSIGGTITNNLSNATGTIKFSNLNWIIPSGATKTLMVETDLSHIPVSGSSDNFSFDIAATTDVSALDGQSNSLNVTGAPVNGTTGPSTYVTVNSVGTLVPALDAAGTPGKASLYWGQTDAPFARYKFTSTNEGFFIERMNLYTGDTAASLTDNVSSVKITYKNKAGDTLSATNTFGSNASTSFAFSDDQRPYVPKDGILYVDVTGNIRTAADKYRATGVNFSIDFSGADADEFRAVGEGSGTVIAGDDANVINVTGANNMYAYRSWPKFTYLNTPGTSLSVGNAIMRFKIDAMGLASDGATVLFDGATGATSGSLKFALSASGSATNSVSFQLIKTETDGISDGNIITGTTTATNTLPAVAGSLSMAFGTTNVEIQAGHSKTFEMQISAVTGFANGGFTGRGPDRMQLFLRDNGETPLIYWTDKGGVDRIGSALGVANYLRNLPMNGGVVTYK